MIHQKIPQEIKTYCGRLIREHNFGRRGIADGNREEQYTGLVGQCMICKLFDAPLPTGEGGFDQGVDLTISGLTVDVKTMGRTTPVRPHYVNNFIGLQKDYKTDIYIFCSINKKTSVLTVCGWVTKAQLLERASFHKKGTRRTRSDGSWFRTKADLYEIENTNLNPVKSIEDLKKKLGKYANQK
ncbi:MAG: hypothetical protein GXO91_06260 [FCB group bacterium]|nr:hypothetical protein [FCB group bacterium]